MGLIDAFKEGYRKGGKQQISSRSAPSADESIDKIMSTGRFSYLRFSSADSHTERGALDTNRPYVSSVSGKFSYVVQCTDDKLTKLMAEQIHEMLAMR